MFTPRTENKAFDFVNRVGKPLFTRTSPEPEPAKLSADLVGAWAACVGRAGRLCARAEGVHGQVIDCKNA
eukprot:7031477-Prymnesium_polylepis.1